MPNRRADDDATGAADPTRRERPAPATLDEGIETLQKAAGEAVRAARALLDIAERVIEDPEALRTVMANLATMARSAGETVATLAADATAGWAERVKAASGESAGAEAATDPGPDGDRSDRDDAGIQRIRVD